MAGDAVSVLLLVFTDGRDELLVQTVAAAERMLVGNITRKVMHTDNGLDHLEELTQTYPDFEMVGGERAGFGGAIDRAWKYLIATQTEETFVFWLEDDFIIKRPVELDAMSEVLSKNPDLVQLVLKRQPWNADERKAGGIIEQDPMSYTEVEDRNGRRFVEHQKFFSTNPNLIRTRLVYRGWPQVDRSEGIFTLDLLKDHPESRFAFWGSIADDPWVEHIGKERVGSGY